MKCRPAALLSFFFVLAMSIASAAQAKEAGGVIIRDEPDYWGYVYPELVYMKADVVKFHLSYDGDWASGYPVHFGIPAAHLNGAIQAGVKDIIVRTAETKVGRNEINQFIQTMTFWDTGETLTSYINNHRQVNVWIEVGNEPDNAGVDPWVYRWNLLDVAKNVIPSWTWIPNLHWIASAPAHTGNYTNIFYTTDADGNIQTRYEGIGTHEYGDYSLNMAVTNNALSVMPGSGHVVWITEAGINSPEDWATKGNKYKQAIWNNPDGRIRGWTFFLLNEGTTWNTCPASNGCFRYAMDIYYNSANQVPGRPCASALAGR